MKRTTESHRLSAEVVTQIRPRHQNRAVIPFLVMAILFFITVESHAQQNLAGHATDFNSVEYYPAPNQTLMRSQLSGAEAAPMEGGRLLVRQLKLEMFAANSQLQLVISAPECVYDSLNGEANSAGKLALQNGDGKIQVEGEGFLWRQADSFLTISNNVKTFIASVAFMAAGGLNAPAQTNHTVAADSGPRVTHIDSDRADFDLNGRKATYDGNVRVNDPQMKLFCEWLVADLPQSGQINHIVAKTNVVIDFTDAKGQVTHATGEMAVYDYNVKNGTTNETVTLTGNPRVEGVQGNTTLTNTADTIIWDRLNNSFRFINPHATFENLNDATAKTNPPPANTNELVAPK